MKIIEVEAIPLRLPHVDAESNGVRQTHTLDFGSFG